MLLEPKQSNLPSSSMYQPPLKKDAGSDSNKKISPAVVSKISNEKDAKIQSCRQLKTLKQLKEQDKSFGPEEMRKRESAARLFQTLWKKCKGKPDYNGPLGGWLKHYQKDFVAHAIWKTNVNKVLDSGAVKPAEQVFKEAGEVEYEAGATYGTRDVESMGKLSHDQVKALPYKNCGFTISVNGKEVSEYPNLATLIPPKTELRLISLKEIRQMEAEGISEEEITRICDEREELVVNSRPKRVELYLTMSSVFEVNDYANINGFRRSHVQLLRDKLSPVHVDDLLARHYEYLLATGSTKKTAFDKCYQLRDGVIACNKRNPEIRAGQSEIWWSYGDVVVLRGHGKEITGSESEEAILLTPFQNKGKYFNLELAREDTCILGPKAILEPFKKSHPEYNIVYIEEMTPRQKNILRLPWRLDAVGQQALKNSCSQLDAERD